LHIQIFKAAQYIMYWAAFFIGIWASRFGASPLASGYPLHHLRASPQAACATVVPLLSLSQFGGFAAAKYEICTQIFKDFIFCREAARPTAFFITSLAQPK
jgi:hypothetical protein